MHNKVGELKMQREQSMGPRGLPSNSRVSKKAVNWMGSVDTGTFLLTDFGVIERSSLGTISDALYCQKFRNNRRKNNALLKC